MCEPENLSVGKFDRRKMQLSENIDVGKFAVGKYVSVNLPSEKLCRKICRRKICCRKNLRIPYIMYKPIAIYQERCHNSCNIPHERDLVRISQGVSRRSEKVQFFVRILLEGAPRWRIAYLHPGVFPGSRKAPTHRQKWPY